MDSFSDISPTSTIDPKDMQTLYVPLSPPGTSASSTTGDTPASVNNTSNNNGDSSTSAPRKKRKSWGQQLPKPTTNLPPRKRAKTEAEKQQRLYERVQRNRQAAHNSRMRKQDEMDRHIAENNRLKQDNQHLNEEVQRLRDELARYRRMHNLAPPKFEMGRATPPTFDFTSLHSRESTPSLSNGSSLDAASIEEPEPTSMPNPSLYSTPATSDIKPFNDSHSAVMCSQQWTLDSQNVSRAGTVSAVKT